MDIKLMNLKFSECIWGKNNLPWWKCILEFIIGSIIIGGIGATMMFASGALSDKGRVDLNTGANNVLFISGIVINVIGMYIGYHGFASLLNKIKGCKRNTSLIRRFSAYALIIMAYFLWMFGRSFMYLLVNLEWRWNIWDYVFFSAVVRAIWRLLVGSKLSENENQYEDLQEKHKSEDRGAIVNSTNIDEIKNDQDADPKIQAENRETSQAREGNHLSFKMVDGKFCFFLGILTGIILMIITVSIVMAEKKSDESKREISSTVVDNPVVRQVEELQILPLDEELQILPFDEDGQNTVVKPVEANKTPSVEEGKVLTQNALKPKKTIKKVVKKATNSKKSYTTTKKDRKKKGLPTLLNSKFQPGKIRSINLSNEICLKFAWCPETTSKEWHEISGGKDYFMMGKIGSKDNSSHRVILSKGFWMGVFEIRQCEWECVMGNNNSYVKSPYRPMDRVSWDDCQLFIAKVKEITGIKINLPTEAQWEYACLAGMKEGYAFNNFSTVNANFGYSRGGPISSGGYEPNSWNLYDMHGNVWEWCRDNYSKNYCNESPLRDPYCTIDSNEFYVLKGGAWNRSGDCCAASYRLHSYRSGYDVVGRGFRVMIEED